VDAYLERSRSPWYSFLAILPLLALYHIGVVLTSLWQGGVIVNGADALLQAALRGFGVGGWLSSAWFLAIVAGIWIYKVDPFARKGPPEPRTFLLMIAESTLYAMLFGGVVATLVHALMPWVDTDLQLGEAVGRERALVLSLGAGLYEELVFRVFLMGSLIWVGRRFFGLRDVPAVVAGVVISSLIFSAFHYVGPLGDTFQLASFAFRFVAGLVLAGLYALRGFGVAAYTHALYDLFLVLRGG
jgi:membrane protease YdiL (CAAX protease family)